MQTSAQFVYFLINNVFVLHLVPAFVSGNLLDLYRLDFPAKRYFNAGPRLPYRNLVKPMELRNRFIFIAGRNL